MFFNIKTELVFEAVGATKAYVMAISVNGKRMARVCQSTANILFFESHLGFYAEFTRDNGQTYFWTWSAGPNQDNEINKASEEAVRIFSNMLRRTQTSHAPHGHYHGIHLAEAVVVICDDCGYQSPTITRELALHVTYLHIGQVGNKSACTVVSIQAQ